MRYFPTPYPDELLGSLLIRACHHLGLSPKALVNLLDDGSGDMFFLYPSFFQSLSRLTNLTPEDLLLNHTVFPYAAIGLPPQRRALLKRELLNSTGRGNSIRLRASLGLHVESLSHRRFCPICREEECNRIGESYWHCHHMLPGVFVCPEHGEPLSISDFSVLPKLSTGNAKLPQELSGTPADWKLDAGRLQRLAAAVLEATELPAETWLNAGAEYLRLADNFDRSNAQPGWDASPLALGLITFYGEGFLDAVSLGLSSVGPDSWPVRLTHGLRPTVQSQLCHILLRHFLKF